MDKSLLVKIFGFTATLVHGDPLVLDRWRWLRKRLPLTRNKEKLIDIGCGSGAFSLGASLRGYDSLGLSWDERNQGIAAQRAEILKCKSCKFEVVDVRNLDTRKDFKETFDVAICFENIEHIMNDRKLMVDAAACLKPGGRLLLTTPYVSYIAMSIEETGPFSTFEDGGHVRRGYSEAMLTELCDEAGLMIDGFSFCSGFLSQKLTSVQRFFTKIHPLLGWVIILPLRLLPPLFDPIVTKMLGWTQFSICLEAYKPRFKSIKVSQGES